MATRADTRMRQGGVEPTSPPYQSGVLPLNYRRAFFDHAAFMGQVGIEPTPAVLQTAALPVSCRPFDSLRSLRQALVQRLTARRERAQRVERRVKDSNLRPSSRRDPH